LCLQAQKIHAMGVAEAQTKSLAFLSMGEGIPSVPVIGRGQ